jgi:hypothetical protein
MASFRRSGLFGLLLLQSLLITACGNATTYKVTGSVLYEGKPAVGAQVTFLPANGDKSIMPNGVVKEDGTFELTTFALNDGIPAGDYQVTIYWERKKPGTRTGGDDDDTGIQMAPRRYLKPDTSGFSARITSSTTTLEPFLMTR